VATLIAIEPRHRDATGQSCVGKRPRFRGRPVFASLRRGTPAPEAAPLPCYPCVTEKV
jgi:hypothetical protein